MNRTSETCRTPSIIATHTKWRSQYERKEAEKIFEEIIAKKTSI